MDILLHINGDEILKYTWIINTICFGIIFLYAMYEYLKDKPEKRKSYEGGKELSRLIEESYTKEYNDQDLMKNIIPKKYKVSVKRKMIIITWKTKKRTIQYVYYNKKKSRINWKIAYDDQELIPVTNHSVHIPYLSKGVYEWHIKYGASTYVTDQEDQKEIKIK
ncbi:MAG: hypothetical protein WCO06_07085 [Candidatus Roizmanbacteria bacterium]